MRGNWRSELFKPNSKLELQKLEHLGFPMSIAKGRKILGNICHETWKRWETVAMEIPEYKLIHQRMYNAANRRRKNSTKKITPPITAYQVWVVGNIGDLYGRYEQGIEKTWLVEQYLAGTKDQFTRDEYQKEQERYSSGLLEEVCNGR
jgi:Fe-S cluster biosynthesis and repair protein YggX